MQIKYPSPALQRRRTLRNALLVILGVTVMATFMNQIGQSDDVCLAGGSRWNVRPPHQIDEAN